MVKVGVVELSWDPPEFMEGDSHIYIYACKHNHKRDPHSGKTPNTTVTIENVASGIFSCVVSTTSSVQGHKDKKGPDSDAVSTYVPSNRELAFLKFSNWLVVYLRTYLDKTQTDK